MHEQKDHTLGLRGEHRRLWREWILFSRIGATRCSREQTGQCHATESYAELAQRLEQEQDLRVAESARADMAAATSPERVLMLLGQETMGFNPRFARLAMTLLDPIVKAKGTASFFEIGFGSGAMLEAVRSPHIQIAGIEASPHLLSHARLRLGPTATELHHGLLVETSITQSYDVAYWNDVAEHLHGGLGGLYRGHWCFSFLLWSKNRQI